jgi:hypothetical protein
MIHIFELRNVVCWFEHSVRGWDRQTMKQFVIKINFALDKFCESRAKSQR